MNTTVRLAADVPHLLAGVVEVRGVTHGEAPVPLQHDIRLLVERRSQGEPFPPPEQKDAVRSLLRTGGYKPSGRGKPASEYLAAAARKGAFPAISNLVDTANHYSLLTGVPISLVDLDTALAGCDALELRFGRPGESYAFNPAGQEIDVTGLICLARVGGAPIANPVKDSLETRTGPETKNVLAVLYGSSRTSSRAAVLRMAGALGARIAKNADGNALDAIVLPADGAP